MTQQTVFQLRIRLEDTDPAVWRRVLVPGGAKLSRLHDIFQAAMGWTNSHLHSFTIDGNLYGAQFDDYPEDELDEKEFTVSFALRGSLKRFVYDYDFGGSWTHEVVVEDVARTPHVLKHGVCLDGARACPPEDVGGPGGYEEFLAALADPLHEEHYDYLLWMGYKFDPNEFNLAAANAAVQRIR